MHTVAKKFVGFVLALSLIAPWVYLGTVPPKQAEAQIGAAGCLLNLLFGDIFGMIQDIFNITDTITTVAEKASAPAQIASVWTEAGLLKVQGTTDMTSVPTAETNQTIANLLAHGASSQLEGNVISSTIAGNTGMSAAADRETAGSTKSLTYKECLLDALAWIAKNVITEIITQSLLDWINGGFAGGPAFLTDPAGFFTELADASLDGFLWRTGLDELLCSPFSLDILFEIEGAYYDSSSFGYGSGCSLDQVFNSGIFSGVDVNLSVQEGYNRVVGQGDIDFDGGGFDAVFGMLKDENNAHGAYYNVQSAAGATMGRISMYENQLIVQAKGYFSLRCDSDGDGKDDHICTPGAYVAQAVDETTGSWLSQLEIADEFAEIVDALLAALVNELITSAQGLLEGNNEQQRGSRSSYWGRQQSVEDARAQGDQGWRN